MDNTQKSTVEAPASASVKPYRLLHSAGYVRKLKKMVELVKNFRGIHQFPRPAPRLKANADEAQIQMRNKYENNRLSVDTVHFFAQPYEISYERRDKSPTAAAVNDEMSGKNPVNRL